MTDKAGALAYLIVHTTRNRITKQISRIKNPRYAFALLFGIGYLYLTFLRRGAMPTGKEGGPAAFLFKQVMIFGLLYFTVILTWVFSGKGGPLAFLPAEVQFLFPAPLSRRQLVAYRMVRSQLVVLLNAVVWALLLRRFGVTMPAAIRFFTAWALFSVLSLHQLGAALVLVQPATGIRRAVGWAIRGVAILSVITIVAGFFPVYQAITSAADVRSAITLVATALSSPPISIVLAPFRLIAAPVLAASTAAWFGSFAIVLLIIAAHVGWVLAMDVQFADVAVAASVKRAARLAAARAMRSGTAVAPKTGKATRQWLPLKPVGHPAVAIAWKNTMALIRGAGARSIFTLIAILVPFLIISRVGKHAGGEDAQVLAAIPYLGLVALTLFMGPRLLRNDLRQDLLRLSTLKAFPLKGSVLVFGEILSPTLVLTSLQLLLLTVAYSSVPGAAKVVSDAGISAVVLLLVPFVLLTFNGLNVVIQNGITLMFPSWVRLGADSGGIEMMGQNLLMTFGSMLALLLALLLPIGAGVALVVFVRFTAGAAAMGPALAAGATVAVILLVGEIVAMINIFGRTFDQMDPTAIG